MKKIILGVFASLLLVSTSMTAQIETPQPSPSAMVSQKLGLTTISLDYSRPSAKGRTVFSKDGLVPFGSIWRTGANNVTKITFGGDVMIEGKALKAGSYAILTKPDMKSWAVHFYKHESTNFGSYLDKTPDLAVTVMSKAAPMTFETFTINMDKLTNTGAELQLIWDKTLVPIKIEMDVDKAVMANINRVMAGPSEGDYYAAATYYHEAGKDLKQALTWVQKATKVASPKFWQVRRESLILADLGMKKEAIAAATQSLNLAKEAKNDDYIKMNEQSIAEWTKK